MTDQRTSEKQNKLARKIVTMLEEKGIKWPGGPDNARICRTYAGYWQQKAGAWSWWLQQIKPDDNFHLQIGSYERAREIAKGFIIERGEDALTIHLYVPD